MNLKAFKEQRDVILERIEHIAELYSNELEGCPALWWGGVPYIQYDYDFEFFEDEIVIRLSDRWPDGVVEKHFVSMPVEIFESATDDELLQYAHMKGNEAFDAERFDNIMQVIRKLHRMPSVDVEYVLQSFNSDDFTATTKTRKHIKDNPVDYREEESSGSV